MRKYFGWTVVLATLCPAAALAAVGGASAEAVIDAGGGGAFSGSTVSYRSEVSALTLRPDADPTYNPYVGMILALAPRYRVSDAWYLRAGLTLGAELTHPDVRNDRAYVGDTTLALGAPRLLSWRDAGLVGGAELLVAAPTSKESRAATRLGSAGVKLFARKKAGAATLGVGAQLDGYLHRHNTGGAAARLTGCALSADGCVIRTGVRNPRSAATLSAVASYDFTSWMSLSAVGGVISVRLLPMENGDERISYGVKDPSSTREFAFLEVAAEVSLTDSVSVAAGTSTYHLQLAPDGTYRAPGFNRETQLFIDLRMDVGDFLAGS